MPGKLSCPRCSSRDIVRNGSVISPKGRIQRYLCKSCDKKFHLPGVAAVGDYGRVAFLDVEASRLDGAYGVMLSWAVKRADSEDVTCEYLRGPTIRGERKLLTSLLRTLRDVDTVVTYCGSHFDIPFIRTRCLIHGIMFPGRAGFRHLDLYYTVRDHLRLPNNRLQTVLETLGLGSVQHLSPGIWAAASIGDKEALRRVAEHNTADVLAIERLFERLREFVGLRPLRLT